MSDILQNSSSTELEDQVNMLIHACRHHCHHNQDYHQHKNHCHQYLYRSNQVNLLIQQFFANAMLDSTTATTTIIIITMIIMIIMTKMVTR